MFTFLSFMFIIAPIILIGAIFIPGLRTPAVFIISICVALVAIMLAVVVYPAFSMNLLANILLFLVYVGAIFVYCLFWLIAVVSGIEPPELSELTDVIVFFPLF